MSIISFFSIAVALLWAVSYVLIERSFTYINVTTVLILGIFSRILVVGFYAWFFSEPFNLKPVLKLSHQGQWSPLIILLLGLLATSTATLLTWIVTKNVNATYAAVGEIAHPIFIPLLTWMIFREINVSLYTIIGGILVASGIGILIWGQSKGTL